MDIVKCGFVKDLSVNHASGQVKFRLELTTPACPIKDDFEQKALAYVSGLDWVTDVDLTMDATPPRPIRSEEDRPQGLRSVAHVIAVSSCKGGEICQCCSAINSIISSSHVRHTPQLSAHIVLLVEYSSLVKLGDS